MKTAQISHSLYCAVLRTLKVDYIETFIPSRDLGRDASDLALTESGLQCLFEMNPVTNIPVSVELTDKASG